MGRSVVIAAIGMKHCGIPVYRPGMEVWGINDAPQHCPEIKRFYKIYNIHKDFPKCIENLPGRYKNWENVYNKSKALIITAKDLGLQKQRILDITKLREDNPDYVFCSSVSFAIFEAVQKGYKEIRLYRLSLNRGEYATQGRGIIKNIRWAQDRGVQVYWPWYKEVVTRCNHMPDATDIFYGEADINMQYGESNDVEPCKVSDDAKVINVQTLTIQQLKKAIKDKGGKLPKGRAKKEKLINILMEIQENGIQ
jgi:hypothetical protein